MYEVNQLDSRKHGYRNLLLCTIAAGVALWDGGVSAAQTSSPEQIPIESIFNETVPQGSSDVMSRSDYEVLSKSVEISSEGRCDFDFGGTNIRPGSMFISGALPGSREAMLQGSPRALDYPVLLKMVDNQGEKASVYTQLSSNASVGLNYDATGITPERPLTKKVLLSVYKVNGPMVPEPALGYKVLGEGSVLPGTVLTKIASSVINAVFSGSCPKVINNITNPNEWIINTLKVEGIKEQTLQAAIDEKESQITTTTVSLRKDAYNPPTTKVAKKIIKSKKSTASSKIKAYKR